MAQTSIIGRHCTTVSTTAGVTRVTYHATEVVAFTHAEIRLNSGGWRTVTTKCRMNQAANQFELGYRVWQKDFEWYVTTDAGTFDFYDNMRIDRISGKILTD